MADAIVLGAKQAEGTTPADLYQQIMFRGLLKPGGLLLLEAASKENAMAPLLKMINKDIAASVLLPLDMQAQDGTLVVELNKGWSAGMPTPSMCASPASGDEDDAGLRKRKNAATSATADKSEAAATAVAAPAKAAEPSAMQNRLR